MNHPEYPLQHEQRAMIIMDGKTTEDVERIQRHFTERRNREFPGWQEWYENEVGQWLAWQKKHGAAYATAVRVQREVREELCEERS